MRLDQVPARCLDGSVNVLVEIPSGSRNKYEYDSEMGMVVLDRVLHSAVHYPTDYGFVPGTRGTDGEPLDTLVMVEEPTFPGCVVRVRLVGVLTIEGSKGPEQKLLGVPVAEPRYAEYSDIADIPPHLLKEIGHFFEVFKDLEGSDIRCLGWEDAESAHAVLEDAVARGRA